MSNGSDAESLEVNKRKPTLWELVKTTLFAAVGVQSDANRELDFSQSSPLPYIIMGVLFTVVFISVLVAIASAVIPS